MHIYTRQMSIQTSAYHESLIVLRASQLFHRLELPFETHLWIFWSKQNMIGSCTAVSRYSCQSMSVVTTFEHVVSTTWKCTQMGVKISNLVFGLRSWARPLTVFISYTTFVNLKSSHIHAWVTSWALHVGHTIKLNPWLEAFWMPH